MHRSHLSLYNDTTPRRGTTTRCLFLSTRFPSRARHRHTPPKNNYNSVFWRCVGVIWSLHLVNPQLRLPILTLFPGRTEGENNDLSRHVQTTQTSLGPQSGSLGECHLRNPQIRTTTLVSLWGGHFIKRQGTRSEAK